MPWDHGGSAPHEAAQPRRHHRGIPLQAAYCGAKHAVRGFTESLRAELLHEKIGINTPQFDWARTHLPREPRPVPPIIEPEVAAEAIFKAAQKPRREFWLGLSTAKVILGNMILPGFLDVYLAQTAYVAQETQTPVPKDRKDNLFMAVPTLHRTRGSLSEEEFSANRL
jgi:NAD(P)-dependent dehydrogenase (short-subunit alcohol dehydrogenase family)